MSKRTAKKVADFATTVQRDNGLTNKQIADAFGFPPGYMSILRNDPDNLPEKTIGMLEEWMLSGLTLEEYQMANVTDSELPPPKIPAEDTPATPVVKEKAKKERKLKLKVIEVPKKKKGFATGSRKYCTNGKEEKLLDINSEIPEGWKRGRIPWKNGDEVLNIIKQDDVTVNAIVDDVRNGVPFRESISKHTLDETNIAKAAEEKPKFTGVEGGSPEYMESIAKAAEEKPAITPEQMLEMRSPDTRFWKTGIEIPPKAAEEQSVLHECSVLIDHPIFKQKDTPFINTPDTPHEAVDHPEMTPEQMRKMLDSQKIQYVPRARVELGSGDIHQKIILDIEIRVTVKQ